MLRNDINSNSTMINNIHTIENENLPPLIIKETTKQTDDKANHKYDAYVLGIKEILAKSSIKGLHLHFHMGE